MENFKSTVPDSLQAKMKTLAETILEEWRDITGRTECVISPETVGEIEGNYRDGWMPHQDGGFTVSGYYQNDEDSSYHFTENQTEYVSEQAKQCLDSFCADNGYDAESLDWEDDAFKEEFYEYEREWYEEALLQYEIYCNGFGSYIRKGEEQTVTIRVSINYKDAPYYRGKYAEDIKERTFTIEEFMMADVSAIIEEFTV